MNEWIGIGRITADPELRKTQSNKSVCNFTIAVNRRFSKDGEKEADFFNCIAWEKTAEFISKYFRKGKMIAVKGELQNRNWEDKKGSKHTSTEVIIDLAEFCGDKSDNNEKPVSENTSKANTSPVDVEIEDEDELPF